MYGSGSDSYKKKNIILIKGKLDLGEQDIA